MKRYKPYNFNEGKNPFSVAKSQDQINNEFKDKLSKYVPEFKNISYEELFDKYKIIASIVNEFYNKTYDDRKTNILQFWSDLIEGVNLKYPKQKILKIVNMGNKKYAVLTNGEQVHINPKEIVPYIEFRLKH